MNVNDLYDGVFSVKRHFYTTTIKEAGNKDPSEWGGSDVDLDVTPDGDFEVSSGSTIHLEYNFVLDWKKWGIKDIEISFHTNPQFNIAIGKNDVDVTIPVESINISWIPGRHYAPLAMYVTVDKYGKVKSADLNVSYIEH